MRTPRSCLLFMCFAVTGIVSGATQPIEENIVFPADAGVIDVTSPPYSAKGDGITDCTDAIQRAFDDHPSNNRIIYFPNGIYLVSHQIEFGISRRLHPERHNDGHDPNDQRATIMQGQSRSKTIIKLQDNCPDFQEVGIVERDQDIGRPKARGVVWTGEHVAQHFRNAIRNLTVDTGSGNNGAAGVQFNASNQGCMHQVRIVSGDGLGAIGLDVGFTGDAGPACARHLEIVGFEYGIWASSMNSFVIWDVSLKGQRKAGIRSPYEVLSLHRIRSDNRVPALWVGNRWSSFVTLIEASFVGGDPDQPAILIDGEPNEKHVFARDVTVKGYGLSVRSTADEKRNATGNIVEYSHGPARAAFADCVATTLRLPIKDEPLIPWGNIDKDWANVMTFGAIGDGKADDTAAVQKAIDSGAMTVYFPGGKSYDCKNLVLRGAVHRFIACEAYINAEISVEDGTAPAVIIERFRPSWDRGDGGVVIRQRSKRSLVVRDIVGEIIQESPGDLFVNDVCGTLWVENASASAWCRYLNYEPGAKVGLANKGGTVWVMGSKVEHPNAPQALLTAGSRTELLGGMWYAGFGDVVPGPGLHIVDSAVSIVGHRHHSFGSGRWANWILIERSGESFPWNDWAVDAISSATPADLEAIKKLPR